MWPTWTYSDMKWVNSVCHKNLSRPLQTIFHSKWMLLLKVTMTQLDIFINQTSCFCMKITKVMHHYRNHWFWAVMTHVPSVTRLSRPLRFSSLFAFINCCQKNDFVIISISFTSFWSRQYISVFIILSIPSKIFTWYVKVKQSHFILCDVQKRPDFYIFGTLSPSYGTLDTFCCPSKVTTTESNIAS